MKHRTAEIIREFGPFPGIDDIAGVSFDSERVWFASGDRLNALDPESGEITGSIATAADAGTAFDGTHLFQIADDAINRIDPTTGEVLATIPTPGDGGIRDWLGPRGSFGLDSIAAAGSTRWIQKAARFIVQLNRIAS